MYSVFIFLFKNYYYNVLMYFFFFASFFFVRLVLIAVDKLCGYAFPDLIGGISHSRCLIIQ
jgi:hypothetical protein